MSKRTRRKQQAEEDPSGCVGAVLAVPVFAFLWFQIAPAWNETSPKDTPSEVTYSPPTPKEQASRECSRAIERKYSVYRGFDIIRLTSQPFTIVEQEDGSFFTHISVPFKTVDARTGKRNRLFWINVKCEVDGSLPAKITETDTAGYPG